MHVRNSLRIKIFYLLNKTEDIQKHKCNRLISPSLLYISAYLKAVIVSTIEWWGGDLEGNHRRFLRNKKQIYIKRT